MQDEVVFLPDHRGINVQHVALISGGFFIIAQLAFLDELQTRLVFTVVFGVFLLSGFWLSKHNSRNWPQKIVINRLGISYGNSKTQKSAGLIHWKDIARMDLFYTDPRLPPHLRIGLRPGASYKPKPQRLQSLSMGLDINIPVSVNVAPELVLQTALQFWEAAEYS